MAGCIRSLVTPLVLAGVLLGSGAPTTHAAPSDAIPVFCYQGCGVGFEQIISCRRADTRVSFTTVPAGLYLHVTDLHVVPNNSALTGPFAVLVGRDDATAFPDIPDVKIFGSADRVNALHFSTPRIILREDESLAVANLSISSFPIDVYVSGYLSSRVAP